MNRRGFISLLAGAAGCAAVPWRANVEPVIFIPPPPKLVGLDAVLNGTNWDAKYVLRLQREIIGHMRAYGEAPRHIEVDARMWVGAAQEMGPLCYMGQEIWDLGNYRAIKVMGVPVITHEGVREGEILICSAGQSHLAT